MIPILPEKYLNTSSRVQLTPLESSHPLTQTLHLNRVCQQQLKNIRNQIIKRMQVLREEVNSVIMRQLCPQNNIISYLKFQRKVPNRINLQNLLIERIKKSKEEDKHMFIKIANSKVGKINKIQKKYINYQSLPNNAQNIDFYQLSLNLNIKQPINVFQQWYQTHFPKPSKQPYTQQEEQLILHRKMKYGQNWQKIAQMLPLHGPDQIYYEYFNHIKPNLKVGRWTILQTLKLVILVEHIGTKSWRRVSEQLEEKNELQARERYMNLVDPTIGKDNWTYELQKKLLELAPQYDYSWKALSQLSIFAKMTDNTIWRQFKFLMIRFSKEQIEQYFNDRGKERKLHEKIIKFKETYQGRKRAPGKKLQKPIQIDFNLIKNIPVRAVKPTSLKKVDVSLNSKTLTPKRYGESSEMLQESDSLYSP